MITSQLTSGGIIGFPFIFIQDTYDDLLPLNNVLSITIICSMENKLYTIVNRVTRANLSLNLFQFLTESNDLNATRENIKESRYGKK